MFKPLALAAVLGVCVSADRFGSSPSSLFAYDYISPYINYQPEINSEEETQSSYWGQNRRNRERRKRRPNQGKYEKLYLRRDSDLPRIVGRRIVDNHLD